MAQTNDIELVNGVYRIWDRRDEGGFYCESADQSLAQKWLAAAADLAGIEALPEGVTIGSTTSRQIKFSRELPFGFDYHWVREVGPGRPARNNRAEARQRRHRERVGQFERPV